MAPSPSPPTPATRAPQQQQHPTAGEPPTPPPTPPPGLDGPTPPLQHHLLRGPLVRLRHVEEWEYLACDAQAGSTAGALGLTPEGECPATLWEVREVGGAGTPSATRRIQLLSAAGQQPLSADGASVWSLQPHGEGVCSFTAHSRTAPSGGNGGDGGDANLSSTPSLSLPPPLSDTEGLTTTLSAPGEPPDLWEVTLADIPVISLRFGGVGEGVGAVPRAGLPHPSRELGDAIVQAAGEVGFFALEGHGLGVLIDDLKSAARAGGGVGVAPLIKDTLMSSTGFVRKAFSGAPEKACPPAWWPVEGLPAVEAYHSAASEVAVLILESIVMSLGVGGGSWAGDNVYSLLRMMRYSGSGGGGGAVGLEPHTDKTWITLLAQDGVGGLEVEGRCAASWLPVPGGCDVVVNIGDALQALSGGLLKSKVHRAALPGGGCSRISFPLFVEPVRWPEAAAPLHSAQYTVIDLS